MIYYHRAFYYLTNLNYNYEKSMRSIYFVFLTGLHVPFTVVSHPIFNAEGFFFVILKCA